MVDHRDLAVARVGAAGRRHPGDLEVGHQGLVALPVVVVVRVVVRRRLVGLVVVRRVVVVVRVEVRRLLVGLVVVRPVAVAVPMAVRPRLVALAVVHRVEVVRRLLVGLVVVRLVVEVLPLLVVLQVLEARPALEAERPVVVVRRPLVARPDRRVPEALPDLQVRQSRPAWPRRRRRRSPC